MTNSLKGLLKGQTACKTETGCGHPSKIHSFHRMPCSTVPSRWAGRRTSPADSAPYTWKGAHLHNSENNHNVMMKTYIFLLQHLSFHGLTCLPDIARFHAGAVHQDKRRVVGILAAFPRVLGPCIALFDVVSHRHNVFDSRTRLINV